MSNSEQKEEILNTPEGAQAEVGQDLSTFSAVDKMVAMIKIKPTFISYYLQLVYYLLEAVIVDQTPL